MNSLEHTFVGRKCVYYTNYNVLHNFWASFINFRSRLNGQCGESQKNRRRNILIHFMKASLYEATRYANYRNNSQ